MRCTFRKSSLLAVLLLAAGELVLRFVLGPSMTGRFEHGYHPTAGFFERSDGTVELKDVEGRPFYPQKLTRRKQPGVYRIMVFGDSVPRGLSRGEEAHLENTYIALLAEKLLQRGHAAESFNLALSANGSVRNQIVLRKALDYEPDLVVLHINDSNEHNDDRDWKRAQEFKGWHPKHWLMKSFLIRRLYEAKTRSITWKWLPLQVRAATMVNDADAQVEAYKDEARLRSWEERVKRITIEDINLAQDRGVSVLLVTQVHVQNTPDGKHTGTDNGFDAFAKEQCRPGVYHISLRDVFAPMDYAVFTDTLHFNRRGHLMVAEEICDLLERNLLLPDRARSSSPAPTRSIMFAPNEF